MHGAGGGHGTGKVSPAYKHGMCPKEAQETRKDINERVCLARELEKLVGKCL